MGTNITQQEIREWKKQGWKFRIKTVKGKKYITRRKGKLERSLGRYNDKLWKLIQDTRIEPSRLELRLESERLVEDVLQMSRAYHMSYYCKHIVDRYCNFWKYKLKPDFFYIVDDRIEEGYYKRIDTGQGSSFWAFKAVNFFCKNCPAFREE